MKTARFIAQAWLLAGAGTAQLLGNAVYATFALLASELEPPKPERPKKAQPPHEGTWYERSLNIKPEQQ